MEPGRYAIPRPLTHWLQSHPPPTHLPNQTPIHRLTYSSWVSALTHQLFLRHETFLRSHWCACALTLVRLCVHTGAPVRSHWCACAFTLVRLCVHTGAPVRAAAQILSNFNWMSCPRTDLGLGPLSCEPSPVFQDRTYTLQ
eukprot:361702-Chlamydomonas_euryale.AAC.4